MEGGGSARHRKAMRQINDERDDIRRQGKGKGRLHRIPYTIYHQSRTIGKEPTLQSNATYRTMHNQRVTDRLEVIVMCNATK